MSRPCRGATRLVAIDGLGGAGKTTLAHHVAELSGGLVVHLDELSTWPEGPDLRRLLQEVVVPLQAGQDARYQAWDWTAMRLGAWRSVPASGVVIIEGSGSSALDIAEWLTFAVWVDCPQDIRLKRTLARDGPQVLGAWEHWSAWEAQYLVAHEPRKHADLIVTNDRPVT